MVDRLAQIVQKAGALDRDGIETELGGHHRGEVGHLERVVQHVLPEGGAVAQTTEGVDQLGMQIMDAGVEGGLFARLLNALVHQLHSLAVHLLDACRVNTPVSDEVLHRDAPDFAAHRVEAGDGDAFRGVVDNEVRARELLEGADVAALAPDDAALEVVGGNMDGGDGGLGRMIGGHALDGEAQDLAGLLVGLRLRARLGIADNDGGLAGHVVADGLQKLGLGLFRTHARGPLEGLVDFYLSLLAMALDGVFRLVHIALAALHLPLERGKLVLACVEGLDAAVEGFLALGERLLALGNTALGGAHLAHALLFLLFQLLAVAQGLVLRLDLRFSAHRLRLLPRVLAQVGSLAGSLLVGRRGHETIDDETEDDADDGDGDNESDDETEDQANDDTDDDNQQGIHR